MVYNIGGLVEASSGGLIVGSTSAPIVVKSIGSNFNLISPQAPVIGIFYPKYHQNFPY